MKKNGNKQLFSGAFLLAAFAVWTLAIKLIDVRPAGETQTLVGFATLNSWFHSLTGVHMAIYDLTDLLSVIPLGVCALFGLLGVVQVIRRKSLKKVDRDLLLLGVYYVVVIGFFCLFEVLTVNFRPIFIEGRLEASYPSSTTLLVLSVMPTLIFQADRRCKTPGLKCVVKIITSAFSAFMVIGRLICGVHWFTDILGGLVLSTGLFLLYKGVVRMFEEK